MTWKPSASWETLQERSRFLQTIRHFFDEQGVVEVDTPVLYRGVATDPWLHAFAVSTGGSEQNRYLQTSPEFAMKRLLAAGCGSIYYLGKAFRKEEAGRKHNPEFTMLEWYHPGWDHIQLIAEVGTLFQLLLDCPPAEITTYTALFESHFNLHPHLALISELQEAALSRGWVEQNDLPELDKDGWLDFLLVHGIEPYLGHMRPLVVTDYPASQASLAKTRRIDTPAPFEVAERFEFYYRGIELANGYHELICANEQRQRFEMDLAKRKELGLAQLPIDEPLLAALASGLPVCAGVAVGVDRLLMLKKGEADIRRVLPFSWEVA